MNRLKFVCLLCISLHFDYIIFTHIRLFLGMRNNAIFCWKLLKIQMNGKGCSKKDHTKWSTNKKHTKLDENKISTVLLEANNKQTKKWKKFNKYKIRRKNWIVPLAMIVQIILTKIWGSKEIFWPMTFDLINPFRWKKGLFT